MSYSAPNPYRFISWHKLRRLVITLEIPLASIIIGDRKVCRELPILTLIPVNSSFSNMGALTFAFTVKIAPALDAISARYW